MRLLLKTTAVSSMVDVIISLEGMSPGLIANDSRTKISIAMSGRSTVVTQKMALLCSWNSRTNSGVEDREKSGATD